MLIDTHCHVSSTDYDDIKELVERAKKNQVLYMITSGCDLEANKEAFLLSQKYSEIYSMLGAHPTIIEDDEKNLSYIKSSFNNPKVLGIGEIGLDYHFLNFNKQVQIKKFKKYLDLAQKYNKKVIIHSRDTNEETYNILKEYSLTGVIHSFQGSYELAMKYIELGYYIGINGTITFKNNFFIETVRNLPINKLILETDCPYLCPEPLRGHKNEPANILYIFNFLSEKLNIDPQKLESILRANVATIFDMNV